ncbi:MAG: 2-polyprenylphenol 6-hydroxylase [Hyphomicrobiaceae bacterium]
MASPLGDILRLARAGLSLAQHGVHFVPDGAPVPVALRLAQLVTLPWRALTWPFRAGRTRQARLVSALTGLGPSYIKLGQFLAARPDLVPPDLAEDLSSLQDRLPPFSMRQSEQAIGEAFGRPTGELFVEFGPPVAAASIAQVHKAVVDAGGARKEVAVKVLRPEVERRFAQDLSSFYFAARQIERFHPPSRRLRPVAVVDTLAHSVTVEMDLRMEAAAISEMADNTRDDDGFRVPGVDWQRTAKRVLTLEWVDGIPMRDAAALKQAGHDLTELGNRVIQTFLRHAMRDGFFHADMHQGNLFIDARGDIVAVDFGIMGRLGPRERRFLAEILYGFISQDYRRAAEVHYWAGYVPPHHPVATFAQALRAIGEPLKDRAAEDISIGHLLGQLFQYTEVFDMKTRPELILLQKTMVVVEGVARQLNPGLNMWSAGEPVVREWMEAELGAAGRLKEAREGAENVGKFVGDLPSLLIQAETAAASFAEMARSGIRLDDATIDQIARGPSSHGIWTRVAIWIGALSLFVLALAQFG